MDPIDVPAVLDECVQQTLDSFQGTEMTFVIRRVRKIVRSLLHSNPNPRRFGVSNKEGSNSAILNGGNGSISSSATLTQELLSKEANAKALYQQSHVLDEYLVRKIFMAGQTCLSTGQRKEWAKLSLEEYCSRNGVSNMEGPPSESEILNMFHSCTQGTFFEVQEEDMTTTTMPVASRPIPPVATAAPTPPPPPPSSSSSFKNVRPPPQSQPSKRRWMERNGKPSKDNTANNNNTNAKQPDDATPRVSRVDPIGAAFTLGLHFSERRWDHVAKIARLSAHKANLVLDTNQQFRNQHQNNTKQRKKHDRETTKATTTIPTPPPEHPIHSSYYEEQLPSPPELPPGLSIQELTFIIALALRQGRKQRLTFLFHLLLDPTEYNLKEILHSHPAGGIPTWLLEADQDWILSLASLSHYYLYGGMEGDETISSRRSTMGSVSSMRSSPPSKELRVEPLNVIETIAILLHHDDTSLRERKTFDEDYNNANTQPSKPIPGGPRKENGNGRTRALSFGDTKYHSAKMHVMLAEYLHEVRHKDGEGPIAESQDEKKHRYQLLDSFWDASHSQFTFLHLEKDSDSKAGILPTLWSLEEFLAWADAALPDDSAIDVIMFQMFGMGLLPTPTMEQKLVAESWMDWQVKEAHVLSIADNDIAEPFLVMTESFKNLFNNLSNHETSSKAQSPKKSGSSIDINDSAGGSSVWGGIGGFDGRGGLGYGILYCIDKKWWDKWAKYVGWQWDDGSARNFTAQRKRPGGLSTESLLDRSSIGGAMGSYEMMKKNLKKDLDYVLVPPGVWDILYELYGGGPPLPRMVKIKDNVRLLENASLEGWGRKDTVGLPSKIPRSLSVITHPLVIDCRVSTRIHHKNVISTIH